MGVFDGKGLERMLQVSSGVGYNPRRWRVELPGGGTLFNGNQE